MAATNFYAMKLTIQAMVNRGDGALTNIGESIVAAIRFYERKQFWFNETYTESLTLAQGDSSVALSTLPSPFKKAFLTRVSVNSQWRGNGTGFEHVSFQKLKNEIFTNPSSTGEPEYWAILGNTLYVDKAADQAYTLSMGYVYGDTILPSADGDTSIWFDEARELIKYRAAGLFYQDYLHAEEKAKSYFGKADEWINNLTIDNNTRESSWELE